MGLGDKLYLFAVGINDHHHYVNSFDGTAWSGWTTVRGGGTTLHSDAATAFDNKIYLFAIGIADKQHYMNIYP